METRFSRKIVLNKRMLREPPLEYFDISPEVSEQTAVFPGDAVYCREVVMDFARGDNLTLSKISTTVHMGAHVDAPSHYIARGKGIDSRKLDYYLGDCQVITVRIPRGQRILPEHLKGEPIKANRVIFKTGSFPDPNRWNADFNSISPELVEYLAREGVILVGIDTPSVDPAEDKVLETHQVIARLDLAILEGVVLDHVPDGVYQLVALPLRLKNADASPVRAILIPKKKDPR